MREDGWTVAERIGTCERRATATIKAPTAAQLVR